MRVRLIQPCSDLTLGGIYDAELNIDGRRLDLIDDTGISRSIESNRFEPASHQKKSEEPAATTNVVIDGPGEYVTREGKLTTITGLVTDEYELSQFPDHVWDGDDGTYRPDGTWSSLKGVTHRFDLVRKAVMPSDWDPAKAPAPHGAETKPSNPKDVIGSTKPPLSCVPTGPLYEVGAAMLDGSAKYGRHNWRVIGVRSSVYYDAALRHLMKWWEGEELDQDSGCHHLAHAVACCLIVRDAANLRQLTDDRPVPGGDPTLGVKELIKQIKERYPDPVPPYLASQK